MPRTKLARVYVPKEEDVSRKALKNNEFTYWGPEPIWSADYAEITKREWNEKTKAERIQVWPNFQKYAHLEWFQLKSSERQEIVDRVYEIAIGVALSWYNAMVDDDKQKDYLIEYAEEHFPDKVSSLKKADERLFHGYGAMVRCAMRGAKIPSKWIDKLKFKVGNIAKSVGSTPKTQKISISQPIPKPVERDPKISAFIGLVNGQLDDYGIISNKPFPDNSMIDLLLKSGASNTQHQKVYEHFSKQILEYFQALNGVAGVAEYYEGTPKKQLQKVYNWMTGKASEDLVRTTRKTRKARKKKEKTTTQILKKFSYLKSDEETGLKSISPEDIIGAEHLWVFNVKTRKLGVYHAKDDKGLTIYRKSVENYDEDKSVCKKIRKPKEIVPGVKTAGKVALRHFLENIHAVETPMKSRIGEDTLLVKVVK